ncbi:MAG: hypothetical protein UT15_C0013G0005 [Berkelbacteria bacterium GW2011_GWA1_39_10]|uniref:AMMECR1 domain-containing protein n=1 Tax=Berkelbacteria bacterium GW2011_GWA1_39_10 TaxID=1618332 RepID=A0A0G0NX27_9BACT|nr:MAG: hypothetical protein UT15_C0013G0005 [Berkelbacteria bacterium GW2011_GWA1_39_10]
MNIYVQLAKKTIHDYLNNESVPDANRPAKELSRKAGCFVSLHTKDVNELRGCIGTILPTCKNLAEEIISNAVAACQDSRFLPVKKKELDNLDISVDILSEPEPIASEKSLDPKKYGVIVKANDGRTGLLLPDLEGVDDIDYQVAIARQKAGILPEETVYLYRFTVDRFKEN